MAQILQFQKYPAGCPCAMITTGHAVDKSFIKKCLMVKKRKQKKEPHCRDNLFGDISIFLFLWICTSVLS